MSDFEPREPRVILARTAEDARRLLAERFAESVSRAVRERGHACVALSGGSTPRPLYEMWTSQGWQNRIPWPETLVFFADERAVPHSSADSNGGAILRQLLVPVGVPMHHIHFMPTTSFDIAGAAAEYEATLRKKVGDPPRFDFILLGLGADGHTASLFPGSPQLQPTARLVVPSIAQQAAVKQRLTLTYTAFRYAREIAFLVTGADKRDAVQGTLAGPDVPERWPAQRVLPEDGMVYWYLDADAAGVPQDTPDAFAEIVRP